MTATCPVDPTHRAFHASDRSGQIVCWTCQAINKGGKARGNKYGAVKVETAFGTADSRKEAKRLGELALMEAAGQISALRAHPQYELKAWSPTGPKVIGKYTADAEYVEDGTTITEDVKSTATAARADYRLRKRVFMANNPHITHRET